MVHIVDHTSSQFSKDLTCFHESNESLWILSTMARNESLKIENRESESLRILKLWIRKSGFANPNLEDSYCGFVSEKEKSQITRFVSFWKDSYTNPASLYFTCFNLGTQFCVFFNFQLKISKLTFQIVWTLRLFKSISYFKSILGKLAFSSFQFHL